MEVKKAGAAVRRETLYIFVFSLILSALMEAVFLILGKWDLTVLSGNLLSLAVGTLNFYLMGRTVEAAVDKEEKAARDTMRLSQILRMLGVFVFAVLGVVLPYFNTVAVLLPLFFPRIAIALRPYIKIKGGQEDE